MFHALQSLSFSFRLACFDLVILFAVCAIVLVAYSLTFCRGTGQTTGQNADVLLIGGECGSG